MLCEFIKRGVYEWNYSFRHDYYRINPRKILEIDRLSFNICDIIRYMVEQINTETYSNATGDGVDIATDDDLVIDIVAIDSMCGVY